MRFPGAARALPGRRRRRRPLLLVLVYGVFILLVGATASGLAILVSAHFAAAALNDKLAHDRALVRLWADGNLTPDDLDIASPSPRRIAELTAQLSALTERGEILRIELRTIDGKVLISDRQDVRGLEAELSDPFLAAAGGEPTAAILDSPREQESAGPGLGAHSVIQEYLPLLTEGGEVVAVVGIWRDAAPVLSSLAATRHDVLVLTSVAALVLAVVLFWIFRGAQRRLEAQASALVDATRRDPLTGLLNHGAVVGALAHAVDTTREAKASLALALVDIDNFRLLNDTHGHAAGDLALLEVERRIAACAPAGATVGRYGPDEFLLIGPPTALRAVEESIHALRAELVATTLQFGESDRLPVTISAGICLYPDDAEAVTQLLVEAGLALAEAKASGGDAVCRARQRQEEPQSGSFDVLQGLVIAIDTKDRYTRRHSEDVARYALFLGEQLALSEDELETLRVAGLLHDVGKIGIPDALLRKPGRLSSQEHAIFQQHVALGALIVRDLPNLDAVQAGVRHHHERWDGGGYLEGLAGEQIPVTARILAVADAFSAMTTSRPYRKAMRLEEALKRLGGAAGTQFEERLVAAFIKGMETAQDAPLPGDDGRVGQLWTPRVQAA